MVARLGACSVRGEAKRATHISADSWRCMFTDAQIRAFFAKSDRRGDLKLFRSWQKLNWSLKLRPVTTPYLSDLWDEGAHISFAAQYGQSFLPALARDERFDSLETPEPWIPVLNCEQCAKSLTPNFPSQAMCCKWGGKILLFFASKRAADSSECSCLLVFFNSNSHIYSHFGIYKTLILSSSWVRMGLV